MLDQFLLENEKEILALTEEKTLELAGTHPSSVQLKKGLPIFYKQIIEIIRDADKPSEPPPKDIEAIAKAADQGDEPAMAAAAGQPAEAELAKSAGAHGQELLRLGYTLSHVVHAYGAMCQSITETAAKKKAEVAASDFHALNRCLDVAIAGAVTEFEAHHNSDKSAVKNSATGVFIHEMRNALTSANMSLQLIQKGVVGPGGQTGQALQRSLQRMGSLLEQSVIN
jgi:hypothetical protein